MDNTAEIDATVGFLMQIDKLVQLLESPIFIRKFMIDRYVLLITILVITTEVQSMIFSK
jgi:hypothetical protein